MSKNLWGSILSFLGAIIFSTKAIFVKLAYQYEVDSVSLVMLRMLFALPFFLFIAWTGLKDNREAMVVLKASKWSLFFMGILGYYIASLCDLEGLKYIDASLERVILFVYPTLVVLLSYFFFQKKINKTQRLAILFSYIGIGIALGGNIEINSSDQVFKGALFIIISAITYAIYLVGSGEIAPKIGTRIYNSVAMTIACMAIIIHSLLQHGFNLLDFEWQVYMYAFIIGVFTTVVPSYMIVEGIRLIGANKSSIIGTIGPISTIVLASIVLDESINSVQLLGSIIVVLSVFLVITERMKVKQN